MTRTLGTVSIALACLALSAATADERGACKDDGELSLPDGFCAQEVATDLGPLGQMAITGDGDIYVAVRDTEDRHGGIVGLRDTTDDGLLDEHVTFGERGATGLALQDDRLYVSERQRILSSPLHPDRLGPGDTPRVIAHDLPDSPTPRALLIRDDALYVGVAAQTRYCESGDNDAAGQDPCEERERAGGIWRFEARETGQSQSRETRFAAGIRDATAMHWNPRDEHLYTVDAVPPASDSQGATASDLLRVPESSDFGWPYCTFSTALDRHLQTVAYGGDGVSDSGCAPFQRPLHPLSGGTEPTALLFYGGHQFPEAYRRAAFIAFNGAGDDGAQARVDLVPLDENGHPSGGQKRFADGFADGDATAPQRLLSLAQGPEGSLFVSDSQEGTIWRVEYRGSEGDID
ncbi:PQQ-dependent sugar dehydrogenase [Aquisalimonas asiatica]|uniref:Glucose/arabinose dehydrogenase, beta-propeller fold n=1 Tax=Aquisalimonas asiatica TaxID=406100 RepID=A0A1H8TLB7_9GAMM|nr:PQQ-dependent sugar dehydrogenase [Aquisalimonas asiatica]SEO91645.1 Glucose/arabinose dehydrogenase, beta-propeller fold [Aquisalimonas asiatica]